MINVSPNRSAHQASLPRPSAPLALSRSVRMYCVKVGALRDPNHGRRNAPGLVVLRVFRVLVHPRGPPRPSLLHVTVGALRDQQCGQRNAPEHSVRGVLSVLQAAIPRRVEVGAHRMSKRGH